MTLTIIQPAPGDSWARMTCPDGSDICFQAVPAYSPPSWPDQASSMQDVDVDVPHLSRRCWDTDMPRRYMWQIRVLGSPWLALSAVLR